MPQSLADHTTLRLGGPAARFVTCHDDARLIDVVSAADAAGEPVLVLGGGSNLVVSDDGFPGLVARVATAGVRVETAEGGVVVTAAAGEDWDGVVARTIAEGLAGLECLSGIPGLAGATPIQNVGAYGQEVADTIVAVRCFDRRSRDVITLAPSDCGFGYRTSVFKGADAGRYLVLSVSFGLAHARSGLSRPLAYGELARRAGVETGAPAPLADVRAAVLTLRASKGMVLDPADPDAVSAGSFFMNPVVDAGLVPEGAPAFPAEEGRVKTSAAWLIERAGFPRGYGDGAVGVSGKHTLALINRGGGTTADLLALAREIRDGVKNRFGIELTPEPTLVGVAL